MLGPLGPLQTPPYPPQTLSTLPNTPVLSPCLGLQTRWKPLPRGSGVLDPDPPHRSRAALAPPCPALPSCCAASRPPRGAAALPSPWPRQRPFRARARNTCPRRRSRCRRRHHRSWCWTWTCFAPTRAETPPWCGTCSASASRTPGSWIRWCEWTAPGGGVRGGGWVRGENLRTGHPLMTHGHVSPSRCLSPHPVSLVTGPQVIGPPHHRPSSGMGDPLGSLSPSRGAGSGPHTDPRTFAMRWGDLSGGLSHPPRLFVDSSPTRGDHLRGSLPTGTGSCG